MSEVLAAPSTARGAGLWIRYGIPLLLALVVHGVAVLALVEGWSVSDESRFAPHVQAIDARLIQIESVAPAPAQVVEAPAAARPDPPADTPIAPVAPATEAREAPDAAEAPEPEPEAAQPTRTSDFEDDARQDMLDQALSDAIASEAALLSSQRADAAAASYVGAIVRRIEQNWSRPPSARNGMRCELLIALVPTGEVVSVELTQGSGNAAFDRAALAAVREAGPFEVPDDPVLFEREFRQLRVLFRPEDLRN